MPALLPTEYYGTIVWLGYVSDRVSPEITTHSVTKLALGFAGAECDVHSGLTRASCSRVVLQYPKETEIRNTRQVSIVSAEELAAIAAEIDLDRINPEWLGASIVVEGLPDFSHIPPSARLQSERGATLTVDMQNWPCQYPAKTIEAAQPGHGKRFKPAAKGLRGVTAWVECEGSLKIGDQMRLHVPDQRAWSPQSL